MYASKSNRPVSKAALALRKYLTQAPQAELDARVARVKALQLPQWPTVSELRARQVVLRDFVSGKVQARYTGHDLHCETGEADYDLTLAA